MIYNKIVFYLEKCEILRDFALFLCNHSIIWNVRNWNMNIVHFDMIKYHLLIKIVHFVLSICHCFIRIIHI